MRILILGLDNAGKTSCVQCLLGESVDSVAPTVGFQISTFETEECRVALWDVGGQATIRTFWRNYFDATEALIWVVDSADRLRIDQCRQELSNLLGEEKLAGACLVVLANKQDIPGSLSSEQIRRRLGLDALIDREWAIFPVSARTGEGLREAISWTVTSVEKQVFFLES